MKATRATMNQALEAWKKMPGGPEEDLPLTRSDSSFSKGTMFVFPPWRIMSLYWVLYDPKVSSMA